MLWGHKYCYCGVEGKMMWVSLRMWGGEEIENEIEGFVKILTKCKMKLKSRREEIKWNCGARLAAARAYAPPSPTIISTFSPSTRSASQHPLPPSLSFATNRKSQTSSYPRSSCFAFPFFFIKLPKPQSVAVVAWRGTQLAGPAIAAPSSPPLLLLHPIGWPRLLSGSNGILSVAIGAIGKQRLKINYPISSSSLMNK